MASKAIQTTDPAEEGAVTEYLGGLLAVIERAAHDPNTDVEKVERLFELQERVLARQAKIAFTDAKLAMRPRLPEVTMKGHIIIRDKNNAEKITQDTPFAKFEDLHDAVVPICTEFGFDLKFRNGLSPDGKVRVTTILAHRLGHEEDTYFDLPHDSSGSKNAVQAVGSSTSYAKRYGLVNILNIKIVGEDDDGHRGGTEYVSDEQAATLEALLQEVGADHRRFLKYMGVDVMLNIEAKDYGKAVAALEAKRGK